MRVIRLRPMAHVCFSFGVPMVGDSQVAKGISLFDVFVLAFKVIGQSRSLYQAGSHI